MNAARALREARRAAGLSQTELARRAAVPKQLVNRIERAAAVPRIDTLARLLAAAGAMLDVRPRLATGVDREPIRAVLEFPARDRLSAKQIEALDQLCRRYVEYVVVGDAAARLHGAAVALEAVEVVLDPDWRNLSRLEGALRAEAVEKEVVPIGGDFWILRQNATALAWLPAPRRRVLNRWIDAPTGFLASIADLSRGADFDRRRLLAAVQDEVDRLWPGQRIYRAGPFAEGWTDVPGPPITSNRIR